MTQFHGPEQSEKLRKAVEERMPTKVSDDELEAISKKMSQFDELFDGRDLTATYKIELQFGKNRSAHNMTPFAGAMSLFLSGTKFDGGGDEKLYMCPKEGCTGVLFPNERISGTIMCRECEMMWDEKLVIGEKLLKLTPINWAHLLVRYYVLLDHRADIYVKYHPTDIRYKTALEMARDRGGEELWKARGSRGLHIYPLINIIKDVSAGSTLYERFLAFITS